MIIEHQEIIEKITSDLIDFLIESTSIYRKSVDFNDLFNIVRFAGIGFAGNVVLKLCETLDDNEQVPDFLINCQEVFNIYIEKARKKYA